jgi:cytochrome c-type biogenesis protein CcmH/NrfG
LLGDLHFTENRHQAAIDAYQRAAALDPDNPEALNNLAWALAVRPEASPDELRRSLDLAGRAARIEPAPYILDTLAEAYFRNGRPRAALAAIEEAIRRAGPGDDKSYLRQQKDRFEAALEPTP